MLISRLRELVGRQLRRRIERRALRIICGNEPLKDIVQNARRPGFKYYEPDVTTNVDYSDSLTLYEWVKTRKPKEVLEFGPGVSTLVIAQAMHENGFGRITTLENLEKFHMLAKQNCPEHLQPYIDFRLSPTIKKSYGPFHGVGYEHIPERNYEFVFVDGPNYDANTEFDVDVLEVIARSDTPVSAVIDSRTGSSFIYHLVLGKKFRYRYLTGLGFIDQATKEDLLPYKRIVADAMKRRAFQRL